MSLVYIHTAGKSGPVQLFCPYVFHILYFYDSLNRTNHIFKIRCSPLNQIHIWCFSKRLYNEQHDQSSIIRSFMLLKWDRCQKSAQRDAARSNVKQTVMKQLWMNSVAVKLEKRHIWFFWSLMKQKQNGNDLQHVLLLFHNDINCIKKVNPLSALWLVLQPTNQNQRAPS